MRLGTITLPKSKQPTLAQFREKFPEFAATDDAKINSALETAQDISAIRQALTLYLAAHIVTITGDNPIVDGGAGEVRSQSTGGKISMSFKTQAETERDVFYTTTPYGRTFLAMERRSGTRTIGVFVA